MCAQKRNERDRVQPTHVQPLFVCSSKATHRTGKRSQEGPSFPTVEAGGVAVGQSSTLPEQHVPNDVTGLGGLVGAVGVRRRAKRAGARRCWAQWSCTP